MSAWSAVKSAVKSALRFPAYGGYGVQRGGIDAWVGWSASHGYDYREAAGDLHHNGVVMACLAWMMRAFPEPTLRVVKEDAAGENNEVPKHPLTLAFKRPNDYYGADCLWQRIIFDRSAHGQAFLYKMRNTQREIVSLWHVPQHRLIPQWDASGKEFIDHYLFTVDARQDTIPREDLVHFRFGGDVLRERNGLAVLGGGLREIGMLNEGANYKGALLNNMGVPSHLLQSKDPNRPIDATAAAQLLSLWEQRVCGKNRGKPIIPNWAIEAVKIGMSPADLDLGSMTYEAADLVCGLFGLNAMVVSLSSGSAHKTYSNFGESREAAYENALVPAWKQVAQDLTLQLLPDYSDDESEAVEFCTDNVRALQEDQSAVWTRVINAYKAEIIDRYRALQGLGLKPEEADRGIYYQLSGGIDDPTAAPPAGASSPHLPGDTSALGDGRPLGTNGNGNGKRPVGVGA